jgi:hypothetical protein
MQRMVAESQYRDFQGTEQLFSMLRPLRPTQTEARGQYLVIPERTGFLGDASSFGPISDPLSRETETGPEVHQSTGVNLAAMNCCTSFFVAAETAGTFGAP